MEYAELQTLMKHMTKRIATAESLGDQQTVDCLLKRKQEMHKLLRNYVHITGNAITASGN
jgi:DNA-binding ferritin-like protein